MYLVSQVICQRMSPLYAYQIIYKIFLYSYTYVCSIAFYVHTQFSLSNEYANAVLALLLLMLQ